MVLINFSHCVLVIELCLQGGGTRDADVHPDDVICTTSHKVLPTYGEKALHKVRSYM